MSEEQNRFSLRKLSVGLASVLIGVSIFGASQTVKADTVANNQTSSVTNNAQSSDTQENKNAAKSTFSNDNQVDNAKNNLIQTQVEGKKDQKQDQTKNVQQNSVPETQKANDSNDLNVRKDITHTNSLQELDNQSNNRVENNSQTQPQNSPQLAKKVLATNLIETNSLPMTNGGFDEATWGKLDVNNWQGYVQDGVYQLTGYTGDLSHIIVPNEADFEKAGKSTNGLQVGITRDTVHALLSRTTQEQEPITIAFSKTNNQKVKAIRTMWSYGTDWSRAFSVDNRHLNLSDFDGSNLDVSEVTSMNRMFYNTSFHDLSSLANWDVRKVTSMREMFDYALIKDLTPLANWDVSNANDMMGMFRNTSISDLTPLANWKTSKVTDMSYMFSSTSVSDLTPLAHWDTSNVCGMDWMFSYTSTVRDLTPLAHWNVSNVLYMNNMFDSTSVSDLTPLAHWDVSNVYNMNFMFNSTSVSDLTPLAHWNVSKVTDMAYMFANNQISDLTPLAHWKTSHVTNMSNMFAENHNIIDLKPITNWDISRIDNSYGFSSLFKHDTKLNLTNINNTQLMQGFLKTPKALESATFITNNADLVKATINKDLPNSTNMAKRTITFNLPHAEPETIVQTINYKAVIAAAQVDFDSQEIVKTYPIKESDWDWQLDTSKQNDVAIVNGQVRFKSVKIPHINGYKAHFVRNPLNPAMFMVSFVAVPSENKPSNPVEVAPSKPSAPVDNPSKPTDGLQKHVATKLNSNDSDWTMPENNSTYTVEVPDDAIIDLSDLVIAEPVHAQTTTQIRINKRFKLSKKHSIKHLSHRKKAVKSFKKYRL